MVEVVSFNSYAHAIVIINFNNIEKIKVNCRVTQDNTTG